MISVELADIGGTVVARRSASDFPDVAQAEAKVHRAAIALERLSWLEQSLVQSVAFATDAAIPVV